MLSAVIYLDVHKTYSLEAKNAESAILNHTNDVLLIAKGY